MRAEIDGKPATVAGLYRVATVNYGHFTSMQVRAGAVRGLDLHLRRLAESSGELFGHAVNGQRVRELIRHALGGDPDASVRVTVFGGGRHDPTTPTPPSVLVSVGDPVPDAPEPAWRLRTTTYLRELPHVKHVATMGLIRHWRQARADGFDDALFVDPAGRVSEGTAWNLALWDGAQVVWPDAPQLAGITMRLLRAALSSVSRPVGVADLPSYRGAVATYSSWPAQPVRAIDDVTFPGSAELAAIIARAWDTVPWDPI